MYGMKIEGTAIVKNKIPYETAEHKKEVAMV